MLGVNIWYCQKYYFKTQNSKMYSEKKLKILTYWDSIVFGGEGVGGLRLRWDWVRFDRLCLCGWCVWFRVVYGLCGMCMCGWLVCMCGWIFLCVCVSLENDIWQNVRPGLGSHLRVVYDFSLLVVDLFRFLVAQQQNDGAKQKDGRTPANAVRPAELPHWSVAYSKK